jgi:ankyrin repeat protein
MRRLTAAMRAGDQASWDWALAAFPWLTRFDRGGLMTAWGDEDSVALEAAQLGITSEALRGEESARELRAMTHEADLAAVLDAFIDRSDLILRQHLRRHGRQSLPAMAALGDSAKIGELIGAGAELEEEFGPRRMTPLAFAAYSPLLKDPASRGAQTEAVRILIEAGADPNAAMHHPQFGRVSCLYAAIAAEAWEAFELLLAAGADVNDNESLYHSTELEDDRWLARVLAEGAAIEGTNALARALDFNEISKLELLISHGADLNARTGGGQAPLEHAVMRGRSLAFIELLWKEGARDGGGAYRMASVLGRQDLADFFRGQGCEIELSVDERRLADAAMGGSAASIADLAGSPWAGHLEEILPQAGAAEAIGRLRDAGLTFAGRPGQPSPLHWACWHGDAACVRELLAAKPDLCLPDPMHDSIPFAWCAYASRHARRLDGSRSCSSADYPATARLLLEAGSPVLPCTLNLADDDTARTIRAFLGLH